MLWKHATSCINIIEKGKGCHNQDKKAQEASFGVRFLHLKTDMIFGDEVGASLVEGEPFSFLKFWRGSTGTNYFKFSLAGTSTTVF